MKILVAGSSGVVGRSLMPRLVGTGHEVIGLTRSLASSEVIRSLGAHAFIADVFDRDRIMSVIGDVRPDVIIHQLTALSQRDFSENTRIRIQGTRNLVQGALAFGVSRMIAQSIAWAYEPGEGPATEKTPLDVDAPIPRKRLMDGIVALEQAVAEVPNHVILRYGMFYGKGTWYDCSGYMAQEIRQQRISATEGVTSFLHVEDAANAAVLALNWPSGPVNIVDDEPARGTEWLPVYASALGALAPAFEPTAQGWERGASNHKARIDYGWTPLYPTWKTGLTAGLMTGDESKSLL